MDETNEPKDEWIPTRWSLLTRLRDWNDQEGWKEFFDTYWKLIYGLARRAGLTDAEAQEVVQETVVTVAKGMKTFRTGSEHGSFKGWLLKNIRWRIIDQLRKRPPEEHPGASRPSDATDRTETMARVPDPNGPVLDAVWHEEWEKNLMDRALERTKERVNLKHYQVFHLHVIKGMPGPDVARSLGVSLSLVYVAKLRVSRLVRKFYRELRAQADGP